MGKQCKENGYQVKYFFAHQYKWMLPDEIVKDSTFIGNSKDSISSLTNGLNINNYSQLSAAFRENKPDYVYMHNIQPLLNLNVAKLAKNHKSIYIQHIHEPYFENKRVHGGFQNYWSWYLFEYMQGVLLRNTDIVVLSSDSAISLFKKRYHNFKGELLKIPLMYEDLGLPQDGKNNRKYITFIGPPVNSKGPDIFLRIAEWAEKNKLDLNFLIISRKNIDDPSFLNRPNIKVFFKESISDDEIGYYFANSLMTITPYKTAKQSSVALTSYMYGTPVISTNVGGLPEVVHHLKTGYLLDLNASMEEWIKGINYIKEHLPEMSKECRNHFASKYSGTNWSKYLAQLFSKNRAGAVSCSAQVIV